MWVTKTHFDVVETTNWLAGAMDSAPDFYVPRSNLGVAGSSPAQAYSQR